MKQTYTLSRQIQDAMIGKSPEEKEKLDRMMDAAMQRIISKMEDYWLNGTGSSEPPKGITMDEILRYQIDVKKPDFKRNAFYMAQGLRIKAPKPVIYFDGI